MVANLHVLLKLKSSTRAFGEERAEEEEGRAEDGLSGPSCQLGSGGQEEDLGGKGVVEDGITIVCPMVVSVVSEISEHPLLLLDHVHSDPAFSLKENANLGEDQNHIMYKI